MLFKTTAALTAASLLIGANTASAEVDTILNVSYDIGRELYAEIGVAFAAQYEAEHGGTITIDQSHAGSSKQARAILEGLRADVVTFNQVTDVQILHDRGDLIPADWQQRLPNNASPYYSLPAYLVREGNPKNITGWGDLARDDVQVIFPNPKTSGNGRYTYLAAYAWADEEFGGDQEQINAYLTKVFANVPVFDTGGRAATTTFVERGIGDVLITFEAEVQAAVKEFGEDRFDGVVPATSILAEFPVSVVDSVVDARGSRDVAEEYLDFLYSPEGQEIIVSFANRVTDPEVMAAHADEFPEVRLFTVEEAFGGWENVTAEQFGEGGVLDTVFINQ